MKHREIVVKNSEVPQVYCFLIPRCTRMKSIKDGEITTDPFEISEILFEKPVVFLFDEDDLVVKGRSLNNGTYSIFVSSPYEPRISIMEATIKEITRKIEGRIEGRMERVNEIGNMEADAWA